VGRVDWQHSASAVDRLIRAVTPEPGAWTSYDGKRLKLGPVTLRPDRVGLEPGGLVAGRSEVLVGTATHAVQLRDVQPEGKPRMPADAWMRGLRPAPERFDR
jgi:methionyl-tRNA formyltransferase